MRFFDRSGLFKKVHEVLKVNIDCNHKDKILLYGQNANIALQEIKKVTESMGQRVEKQIYAREVREAAAFADFFVTQIYLKTLREQYRALKYEISYITNYVQFGRISQIPFRFKSFVDGLWKEVIRSNKSAQNVQKIVKIVKILFWYHGSLIGRGGSNLKKVINQIVSIDIRFPKGNEGGVIFIGTVSSIEDAE
ncbi:hypothetical protein ACOME3_008101 [Neoechinorhynchus agilis]